MATVNNFCKICPTGCTQTVLPPLAVNQDCFDSKKSQICGIIFLGCEQQTFATDYTDASISSWAAAEIDNTDTTGTKAKYLIVEGGIGEANKTEIELPKGKKKVVSREYPFTGTIKNLSDETYAFIQAIESGCVCTTGVMFETFGGRLLSDGVEGYQIDFIDASIIYDAGKDSYESATISITWSGCASGDRVCSPFV